MIRFSDIFDCSNKSIIHIYPSIHFICCFFYTYIHARVCLFDDISILYYNPPIYSIFSFYTFTFHFTEIAAHRQFFDICINSINKHFALFYQTSCFFSYLLFIQQWDQTIVIAWHLLTSRTRLWLNIRTWFGMIWEWLFDLLLTLLLYSQLRWSFFL